MPVNECIPWEEDADRLPIQASTAITGKRFVRANAARTSGPLIPATAQVGASDPTDGGRIQAGQCVAGQKALGVSSYDMAIGDGGYAITEGVVPVTAGAALTAGQEVQSDANGQAIPWDGTLASARNGTTVDACANGADAQIKLVC